MSEPCTLEDLIVLLFFGIVLAAVFNDVRSLKIENRYCSALVLLYPAYVLTASSPVDWQGAVAVAGVVFAVGVVVFAFRLVGGGDVKFITALSLWAGPASIVPFLVTTALAGGVLAILMLAQSRFAFAFILEAARATRLRDLLLGTSIPYALAIGTGAALTIGPVLVGRWSNGG